MSMSIFSGTLITRTSDIAALEAIEYADTAAVKAQTACVNDLDVECMAIIQKTGDMRAGTSPIAGLSNEERHMLTLELEDLRRERARAGMALREAARKADASRQARIAAEKVVAAGEFTKLEAAYMAACERSLAAGDAMNAHIERGISRGVYPAQMFDIAGPGSSLGRVRSYVETVKRNSR